MKKRYEWKLLSDDGLLKEVRFSYGWVHASQIGSSDTEEEAVALLQEHLDDKSIGSGSYVLLTIYDAYR